jgi:glycerol-3-phosphate acyltransferase PlsY
VLAAMILWISVVLLTRYVSLGSLVAAAAVPVSLPLLDAFIRPQPHLWELVIISSVCFVLILYKHRDNIGRLIRGSESKIGQRVPAPSTGEKA